MHRFILPNLSLHAKIIQITDPSEIHHIRTVLRLKQGQTVRIFNGQGEEVTGKIKNSTAKHIEIEALGPVEKSSASPIRVTLACAIPKKAKFETIIEKCTELGVDRIIPMISERTEVRVTQDRQERKHNRYQTVAINAAKQCQRAFVPTITAPTGFNHILADITPQDVLLIPCLTGERKNMIHALTLTPQHTQVIILIGPEGDFTAQELKAALAAGALPVTLGPNVLKVDTAAIVATAIVQSVLSTPDP